MRKIPVWLWLVHVRFNESATVNFDSDLDAYDFLAGLEEAPSLYTVSADNSDLSINSLPATEGDVTIPVMVNIGINGIYFIEAVQLSNLEDKYVYLKDLKENEITELTEQTVYSFYSSIGDDPARFELLVLNSTLGVDDIAINNIKIYSDRNVVYLINQKNCFSGDLNIFDMTGKLVYTRQLQNSSNFETTLNVEKGFYIVEFTTEDVISTEKVFITK